MKIRTQQYRASSYKGKDKKDEVRK
jgi:hypothetical protein